MFSGYESRMIAEYQSPLGPSTPSMPSDPTGPEPGLDPTAPDPVDSPSEPDVDPNMDLLGMLRTLVM